MNLSIRFKIGVAALCLAIFVAAQNTPPPAPPSGAAAQIRIPTPPTNTPAAPTNAPAGGTNAITATNATAAVTGVPPGPGAIPAAALPGQAGPRPPGAPGTPGADDQLSFQNANIDMVVQWLAKVTGKSVVKHPRVQTQLTIVSSSPLKPRDAINLVYRALALEGFTAIETSKSILIVPEGQEPKTTPEFLEGTELPEGRQPLVKIFQLQHVSPGEVQAKIKTALSDKAKVEINERGNSLIITDYTDNIRLAGDLIKELDVVSLGDTAVEFFRIKYGEADEIGGLLGQILNAQVTTAPQAPRSSPGPSPSSMRSGMIFGGDFQPPQPPQPPPQPTGGGTTGNTSSPIKIWPDRNVNQLIVVAPKSKMGEIKGLLEILDTEKPQDFTIRVLALKNVSAEDLVREISPLLQKMLGKSNRDRVEVSANSRSNSLIVLSTEENFKALQKLISGLDREEGQEKAIRAFELKNGDAEDVAKQLQDLNQDQSNSRYPYYIFGGSSGGRDTKKINVVADRRRNTVIVQAPPTAMEDIEKLIKTLDEPVHDESLAPKIYRMQFVSAADIADVLNELFLKKPQTRSYWDPYGFPQSNTDNDSRSSKLYGKVKITAEPYSNSIIVTSNSAENLSAIEDVLHELDSPSQAGETTMRITLNSADATTVASGLNVLFAKSGSPALRPVNQQPQQQDQRVQQPGGVAPSPNSFGLEQEVKVDAYFPWLGGPAENVPGRPGETSSGATRPVSDLIGKVRVVPDRRSNSILLTSNLHFFPQLLKIIGELDAPTPQVLIEARIIEVASDFRDKLGVRWSPDGKTAFAGDDLDDSVKVSTSTAFSKIFAGIPGASSLQSGVFESSVNVDFLIQFLRKNVNAKILAQPQLNIADNELGKLFVGSQVPFISNSLNTDVGGRNDSYSYRDVGIILEVTPRINSSNDVSLRIRTESSSIRAGELLLGGAILDTRNFRTDLNVRDGETVVLGGIIQSEQSETVRKVPGLGNIPGLRWAFRKKDKVSRDVELMVFLRPRITRSPEQARDLQRELKVKLPLINAWEQEGLSKKEAEKKIKKE